MRSLPNGGSRRHLTIQIERIDKLNIFTQHGGITAYVPLVELILQLFINGIKKTKEVNEDALPNSKFVFVQKVWSKDIEDAEVFVFLRDFRESILQTSQL